jgi:hypothetical protein
MDASRGAAGFETRSKAYLYAHQLAGEHRALGGVGRQILRTRLPTVPFRARLDAVAGRDPREVRNTVRFASVTSYSDN